MDNQIRVLRAERRWSQERLAQELGVSRQTIHALESGRSDPRLGLALRVAALFRRSVEDIFQVGEIRGPGFRTRRPPGPGGPVPPV